MLRKTLLLILVLAAAWGVANCSPPGSDGDGDSDTDADGDGDACTDGDWRCSGLAYEECQDGEWAAAPCDGVCAEELGCVACDPGSRYCEDNNVMECAEDGSGAVLIIECDTSAGELCTGGFCQDSCAEAIETRSNIGCEYWAVDLDNAENFVDTAADGQFAVALANPDPYLSATVTAHINNAPIGEPLDLEVVGEAEVGPGALHIFELPRRDADGDSEQGHRDDGPQTNLASRAFRITSTAPVVAYQFNTLDQRFSNDASLLLPTSGLDNHHIVLSYPPANAVRFPGVPNSHSYVTVLGTEEGTIVTVTPTSRIMAGSTVPEILPGESYEVTLGPFDMLNLETDTVALAEAVSNYPDLTGTTVVSSRPVAVFTGADLSVVAPLVADPDDPDSCCAEHFESQILPTSAMGTRFVINRSPPRSATGSEVDVYRVLAVVDGTTVTTNLTGAAASFSLNAGEFFEFDSNRPFVLESNADHPVHVAQFMVSQTYTDRVIGDPSMLMFPAVEEWRGLYIFTTGRNFSENFAVVSIPEGAGVTLDGIDVNTGICDAPTTIGMIDGTNYVQIVCPIMEGVHEIDSGEELVGVAVYGNYSAGSYAYSAGSNLTQIFLF